jgi:hypothetical protein
VLGQSSLPGQNSTAGPGAGPILPPGHDSTAGPTAGSIPLLGPTAGSTPLLGQLLGQFHCRANCWVNSTAGPSAGSIPLPGQLLGQFHCWANCWVNSTAGPTAGLNPLLGQFHCWAKLLGQSSLPGKDFTAGPAPGPAFLTRPSLIVTLGPRLLGRLLGHLKAQCRWGGRKKIPALRAGPWRRAAPPTHAPKRTQKARRP